MLTDATEGGPDGRWRLKPGIGPARDVSRFAIEVPTAFGSPNSARRQGRSRPDLSLNHRIRAARTSTSADHADIAPVDADPDSPAISAVSKLADPLESDLRISTPV
ncbi:MAG: hypothetical protein IH941_04815 [Acidobacteria bacterium]|nr:hypothetical protein [Acidobacteriota bacterium]